MVKRVVILLAVAAVLIALLVVSQHQHRPLAVSGFIEADEIRLGSRVGGRVARIHADEGDVVTAGQALVELDPFDLLQRQAETVAELAAAEAELQRRETGYRPEEIAQAKARRDRLEAALAKAVKGPREEDIAAARAQVALAEAELDRAQARHDRIEELRARNAANPDEVDEAVRSLKAARAMHQARQEELAKLLAGTRDEEIAEARAQLAEADAAWQLMLSGFRDEEIREARAAVEAARQRMQAVEQQIAELVITAPIDGVIDTMDLRIGDLVPANAPVIALMDASRLWVRAFLPEDALDVRYGQAVTISVDSYPGERFAGRIGFIARQAEFVPGNVQTPEDRSKQVFRIKVYLEEGLDRLRPGMAADVWFEGDGQ
jgi:multidrug resistance efflux pump